MVDSSDDEVDLPFYLKINHYDCLILCSEDDRDLADKLKEIIEIHVRIKDPKSNVIASPKVVTLNSEVFDEAIPIYDKIDMAIRNSNYIFMLFTKSLLMDKTYSFKYNSALYEIFNEKEKMCTLIPLFKNEKDKITIMSKKSEPRIPSYLGTLEGIYLDNLIKDGTFDSLDVHSLREYSFDKNLLRKFGTMFSNKYRLRQTRSNERIVCIQDYKREISNKPKVKEFQVSIDCIHKKSHLAVLETTNIGSDFYKNEECGYDSGCPLYILIEDVEDVETSNPSEDAKRETSELVVSSSPNVNEENPEVPKSNLTKSTCVAQVRPVGRVVPFSRTIENQTNSVLIPSKNVADQDSNPGSSIE